MKKILMLLGCVVLLSSFVMADAITIQLENGQGQIHHFQSPFQFIGNLTNTSEVSIFINSITASSDFDENITYDFTLFQPFCLDGNTTTPTLMFFVAQWMPDTPGSDLSIQGAFQLYGGATAESQDLLSSADFGMVVLTDVTTPEPASLMLLGTGLIGCGCGLRRKFLG